MARHKLCISGIPKCASSTMNILTVRMSGLPGWNNSQMNAHGHRTGLKWINAQHNYDAYDGNFTDTTVVKIAVLRDPEKRFLSGYSDKILEKHQYGRIGLQKTKTIPSVEEVRFLNISWIQESHISLLL